MHNYAFCSIFIYCNLYLFIILYVLGIYLTFMHKYTLIIKFCLLLNLFDLAFDLQLYKILLNVDYKLRQIYILLVKNKNLFLTTKKVI